MKRILVPTDFSPNAEKAIDYAVQIARISRAEIFLLHAAEAYLVPDILNAAREKLELIAKSIRETEQLTILTDVQGDSVLNSILDAIESYKPDLVVMGTVGSSGARERLYGSKTAELMGSTPVPVLAVPLLSGWKVPKKIVLAVNKFDGGEDQLQSVFALAEMFSSQIQVAIFTDTDDDYVEDYDLHEKKIAAFRYKLKASHPDIEIHAVHLAGHHFRESLQHWMDTQEADMLVMITHRRGLIEGILNKSATKKMSYSTNVPLLAIPDVV